MVATELKKRFTIKADENSTNDVVATSNDRFVELMNESYIRYCEYVYEKKNEDDLRYIQPLLVDDKLISEYTTRVGHQLFKLPENYFELSNLWGAGSNGTCSNQKFDLFEIKDLDRNMILNDEFSSPSFKYREAPFNFANNNIRVFTDNFKIDKVYLSYYRYPVKLRLVNPDFPESELDDSYELDLDEKAINRIIDIAIKEFDINNSNDRYQVNQLRAQSKL